MTDGGEKVIPYCFTVADQQGSGLLERLKTIEDFVRVAKTDWRAALRISAYREFWRMSFLRDPERSAFCCVFARSRDAVCGMDTSLEVLGARQGDGFRATVKATVLPRAARSGHIFLESRDTLLSPVAVET